MAVNNYFDIHSYKPTQDMVESVIIEQIQIAGMDLQYVKRDVAIKDSIFNDVADVTYTDSFTIEAYLADVDGFGGETDLMTKFGLDFKDTATFVVSKSRFYQESGGMIRPKEGDIFYFPLTKSLLEIRKVTNESPFFQHGKNYVYEIKVELFEYSDETITTGIDDIDNIGVDLQQQAIDDVLNFNDVIEVEADQHIIFDPNDPFGVS